MHESFGRQLPGQITSVSGESIFGREALLTAKAAKFFHIQKTRVIQLN
jgi:hypothetical protein